MKNQFYEFNLSEITRPVAAIKSLRFALSKKNFAHGCAVVLTGGLFG